MSETVAGINDIPAALPISETDETREKLIREAAGERPSEDENLVSESEVEDFDTLEQKIKPSKKKLFLAFVIFVFSFILLVLILSWFFGIGVFAATKPQAVDRTPKSNVSGSQEPPVTEDEKMKMALNLVAEKNSNSPNDSRISESETTAANSNSSVDIPPTKAADVIEPAVVPDSLSEGNSDSLNNPTTANTRSSTKPQTSMITNEESSFLSNKNSIPKENEPDRQGETAPRGRSVFFGIERNEKREVNIVSGSSNPVTAKNQNADSTNFQAPAIPFGTLLPIRFLGSVFTLRTSGGLVRMELTRSVSGKNYSYPAGTVFVGNLRGSEYIRAFISVVGLIDSETRRFVKLTGEVMGNDGASGISGRRRQVKSNWSRVLGGLRDAGTAALGAIGNRRSGGTVVISDSTKQASGVLSGEFSGLLGNNRNPGEFVEISAGTTGFVLVTDLPEEISDGERLGQNSKTATGLSENELADLFTEGNKERIRAALVRMTPQFRVLAEKVLASEER